ncbi:MAG: tyrosine-type recombinase/integrase [Nitrospirota bacterium]
MRKYDCEALRSLKIRGKLSTLSVLSKSGKTQHVILSESAIATVGGLSSWTHSPFLFPSPLISGQPMQERNIVVKIYEPALKQAGIEETTWHTLRHIFASQAEMAEVDLRTVQELIGHSTITMDMRYEHLSPDHLRNAVKRPVLASLRSKREEHKDRNVRSA